jgi:predicted CopG family antitoxin
VNTYMSASNDGEFSDVIDGLIMVDLRQTNRKMLEKYIGKDNAREFLEFHSEVRPEKIQGIA